MTNETPAAPPLSREEASALIMANYLPVPVALQDHFSALINRKGCAIIHESWMLKILGKSYLARLQASGIRAVRVPDHLARAFYGEAQPLAIFDQIGVNLKSMSSLSRSLADIASRRGIQASRTRPGAPGTGP